MSDRLTEVVGETGVRERVSRSAARRRDCEDLEGDDEWSE